MMDMGDNRLQIAKNGEGDLHGQFIIGHGRCCRSRLCHHGRAFLIHGCFCQKTVKEGGNIANVGAYGTSVNFELEKLWIKNLKITTELINTNTTEMLLKTCECSKLPMDTLAMHHFKFDDVG